MKPGRDLDILIAEHIFGSKKINTDIMPITSNLFECNKSSWGIISLKGYSTNIGYAMEILEKLNNLSFTINRENCMGIRYDVNTYDDLDCKDKVRANCYDSLAHAICITALKHKGVIK